jgi:hypothetical protein
VNIWRFSEPHDDRYARPGRRGSWTGGVGEVCPSCSSSLAVRAQPLVIAWEPGSDLIGDFSWPGFDSEVVVTDPVLEGLRAIGGFEPGPVEVVEDPDAHEKPEKRVPFPYRGPRLHELWVTTSVSLDAERSSVELEHRCPTCGTERWEIYGVDRWDSYFDQDMKQLVRTKTQRLPNAGIFVNEADLAGAAIFRVNQAPAWILCTEKVRALVEEYKFSNVEFLDMGDTI